MPDALIHDDLSGLGLEFAQPCRIVGLRMHRKTQPEKQWDQPRATYGLLNSLYHTTVS